VARRKSLPLTISRSTVSYPPRIPNSEARRLLRQESRRKSLRPCKKVPHQQLRGKRPKNRNPISTADETPSCWNPTQPFQPFDLLVAARPSRIHRRQKPCVCVTSSRGNSNGLPMTGVPLCPLGLNIPPLINMDPASPGACLLCSVLSAREIVCEYQNRNPRTLCKPWRSSIPQVAQGGLDDDGTKRAVPELVHQL